MEALILNKEINNYGNSDYITITVESGNKLVEITKSEFDIQVIYKNHFHKNSRFGAGKFFATIESALKNYKDKNIIACIEAAKEELK